MATVQFATRVSTKVKRAVEKACDSRGLKLQHFVEQARLDKLEELEDIEDIQHIRSERTKPLAVVLKKLKLSGQL